MREATLPRSRRRRPGLTGAVLIGAAFALAGVAGLLSTGYLSRLGSGIWMAALSPQAGSAPAGERVHGLPPQGLEKPDQARTGGGLPESHGEASFAVASLSTVAGYAGVLSGVAWLSALAAGYAGKSRKGKPDPTCKEHPCA